MMKAKSPLLQRAVVTIFLVMMGMHGQAQAADCYVPKPVIIDGKEKPNEPVCEVLARNLNRFCDSPPMVSGFPTGIGIATMATAGSADRPQTG